MGRMSSKLRSASQMWETGCLWVRRERNRSTDLCDMVQDRVARVLHCQEKRRKIIVCCSGRRNDKRLYERAKVISHVLPLGDREQGSQLLADVEEKLKIKMVRVSESWNEHVAQRLE